MGKPFTVALCVTAGLTAVLVLAGKRSERPAASVLQERRTTSPDAATFYDLAPFSPAEGSLSADSGEALPPPAPAPESPDRPSTESLSAAEQARMDRMAENLVNELVVDTTTALQLRSEMLARIREERDPQTRMELVTELSRLDDPDTIRVLCGLLQTEKDSKVREQTILILGFMRSAQPEIRQVAAALSTNYGDCKNLRERVRTLEVISNLPAPESAQLLTGAFTAPDALPEERFAAAEGLFKLAPRFAVDPAVLRTVTDRLRLEGQSASSGQLRLQALRPLAFPGQDNRSFFRELLKSETVPEIRQFLELAAQEHPTR